MKMIHNKKGWIRIVEAFIAILLITGVILVIINKGYLKRTDISSEVYDAEMAILRAIELDDKLRSIIINLEDNILPLNNNSQQFPIEIKNIIATKKPSYLECFTNICSINSICAMENFVEKNIYAQSVPITANLQEYNPRQVKLFCWVK